MATWRNPQRSRRHRVCDSNQRQEACTPPVTLREELGATETMSVDNSILYQRKGSRAIFLDTLSVLYHRRKRKKRRKGPRKMEIRQRGICPEMLWALRLKDLMNPTAEANPELLFSLNGAYSCQPPVSRTAHTSEFLLYHFFWAQAHSSCLPSSSHPHFTSLSLTTQLFFLSVSPLSFQTATPVSQEPQQVGSPLVRHLLFLAHA